MSNFATNFSPSRIIAVRPNLWSDAMEIPDPSRAIMLTPKTGTVVGSVITLTAPDTVASLGLEIGDYVYNADYGTGIPYGGWTTISAFPAANQVTMADNIAVTTGVFFQFYKPGNNGCILQLPLLAMGAANVLTVRTMQGDCVTWSISKTIDQLPTIRVNNLLSENPYDSTSTATLLVTNHVLAFFT
mgnify:CR=1 FL=1